jgi:hypothetical protein
MFMPKKRRRAPKKPVVRKKLKRNAPKRKGARMSDAVVASRVPVSVPAGRPSSLIDTRIIYCGDCLDQLRKLPDACVDLIYIDPPFNSNRNYEVFWGETKEKRAFEDRHASTQAYIEYMRPCCALSRRFVRTVRGRVASIPLQPHPLGCAAADRLLYPDHH